MKYAYAIRAIHAIHPNAIMHNNYIYVSIFKPQPSILLS